MKKTLLAILLLPAALNAQRTASVVPAEISTALKEAPTAAVTRPTTADLLTRFRATSAGAKAIGEANAAGASVPEAPTPPMATPVTSVTINADGPWYVHTNLAGGSTDVAVTEAGAAVWTSSPTKTFVLMTSHTQDATHPYFAVSTGNIVPGWYIVSFEFAAWPHANFNPVGLLVDGNSNQLATCDTSMLWPQSAGGTGSGSCMTVVHVPAGSHNLWVGLKLTNGSGWVRSATIAQVSSVSN
jgi:hypothetical protein